MLFNQNFHTIIITVKELHLNILIFHGDIKGDFWDILYNI